MNAYHSATIFLLFASIFTLCLSTNKYDEEFTRMRMTGELRKACSKRGNAIPPLARVNTTVQVETLRKLMVNETVTKGIIVDAYIIPSSDEHQTEFISEYDKRLAYISGFSGSAGEAIVTAKKAALWTDGRYHLQADEQLDCGWLLMREGHTNISTKAEWLQKEFPRGAIIGVDPKLIAESAWQELEYELSNTNLTLTLIENNLIDAMWSQRQGRPPKRNKDVLVLEDQYSGKNWTLKLAEVRREIRKSRASAMVITALDEIAWLLNIRGRDIPYNPFVRSYVIVDMHDVKLFLNQSQLVKNNVFKHFNTTRNQIKDRVHIYDYEHICMALRTQTQVYKRVLIPSSCAYSPGSSHYIYQCVPKDKRLPRQSPIIFLKAVKNPTEIQGMYSAHVRDAAAMCEFFAYFESRFKAGTAFTELDVVKIMNEFRFEQRSSIGNSFRTIAGFGPNGAQPHYEPTPVTNAKITDGSTLVLDSGGQYYDGTTDLTRTLHMGTPTEDQKQAYTRVLIGQIQLTLLTFPADMKTSVADVMARAPLWEVGLDYLHGTSHGVGSFLGVHESPISMHYNEPPDFPQNQLLKPGYFLSNEPGFYREGEFGIRLENVLQVIDKPWLRHTSDQPFLGFKVVTLVPYEPKLIDLSLLSVHHRRWLNLYNEEIRSQVGAELKRQNLMDGFYWMMEKTNNIPEYGHGNILSGQPTFVLLLNAILIVNYSLL